MTEQIDSITNDHVLEIRYRPNPRILDHRGSWAQQISERMDLQQWEIADNRVDIYFKNELAFVGFRNAGFKVSDSPTKNFFSDKATKLFRILFELEDFGIELFIERLGVRSRFCTKFDGDFERILALYSERYISLSPQAKQAIGSNARLVDAGAPLNFADHFGNFNTHCGPMNRKQLGEFFKHKEKGFPETALYFDIDYFIKPGRILQSREVLESIANFSREAWDRHERVKSLVLGT